MLAATDDALGRQVAIKQALASGPGARARFEREAKLTARLQHAGVVPVYDVGWWPDGEPFFVMKRLEGRPLSDHIAGARSLPDRLALLPRVLAAADTVAYAHGASVVHRDLKPSNIVVSDYGETVVVDWGLAKVLSDPDDPFTGDLSAFSPENPTLTQAGHVLGTPQFMAPEQAQSAPGAATLDQRADVYSLGAVLYNVLAGEPPYAGGSASALVATVRTAPPVRIGACVANLPDDLAAIVDKAMARDPRDRYVSARELADDLRRFLDGRLVSAHRYAPVDLLVRWLRRHRVAVWVAAVLLALSGALAAWAVGRIVIERNAAVAARHAVEARESALVLMHAERSVASDPTAALAWMKQYRPTPERVWTAASLTEDAVALGVARHVFRFPAARKAAAVTPRASLMAVGGRDGLQVIDLRTAARRQLAVGGPEVTGVAFAPGEDLLAAIDAAGVVTLWGLDGRRLRAARVGIAPFSEGTTVPRLAFSGDGRRLALPAGETGVLVLRVADLTVERRLALRDRTSAVAFCAGSGALVALDRQGRALALDPDAAEARMLPGQHADARLLCLPRGRGFVTGGTDGRVALWDLDRGFLRHLGAHEGWVTSIAVSADETTIATGSGDATVRLFPLAGGSARVLHGHQAPVRGLTFLEGGVLASAGYDGTVQLWDSRWGTPLHRFRAAGAQATRLDPVEGGRAVVASARGEARVWPAAAIPRSRLLASHRDAVNALGWSGDGARLASGARDGTARVWDLGSGQSQTSDRLGAWVMDVGFRGRDELLVSTLSGTTSGLEVAGPHLRSRPRAPALVTGPGKPLVHAPSRDRVAWVDADRVLVRDLATGRDVALADPVPAVASMAFSRDARYLVVVSRHGLVGRWDADTGQRLSLHQLQRRIDEVVLSQDSRWAAFRQGDGLFLWELPADRFIAVSAAHASPSSLFFAADSRWLGYRTAAQVICLHDVAAPDRPPMVLHGHRATIVAVTASSAAPLLASGDASGFVRLWNVDTGGRAVVAADQSAVQRLAFAPDGRHLASAGQDGSIRVWQLDSISLARGSGREGGWPPRQTSATMLGEVATTP